MPKSVKNPTKSTPHGTMKLIDPHAGMMECRVCGARHAASGKPQSGGRFWRGAWQCSHGCKRSDLKPRQP
jgi:hypothetical protein